MDWSALVLSFEIALTATTLAGIVGTSVAGALATARFKGRDAIEVMLTAPMILPPTVLGYYLLVALGRTSPLGRAYEAITGSSIVFTRTGAVVAAFVSCLPFVVKSARAAMEEVDGELVAAARTLGAGPLRAFLRIVLPLSRRGVASGLSLAFARALGDFGVTLMVAGDIPGVTRTGALAVYDAVEAGRDADAAGLVAAMTALAIVILYLATKLGQRRK